MSLSVASHCEFDGVDSAIRPSAPKAPAITVDNDTPKDFDRYSLLAPLGKGGMAEVFLAARTEPSALCTPVVIKRLYSHFGDDPVAVQMFLDEARLVTGLSHPNIVQTHEVGMMKGQYCIAMEYLAGQPLQRIIRRMGSDGGMPVVLAVQIAIRVLDALEYAHNAIDESGSGLGIVHRDISPHNVFVTNCGTVKVLDFGIAKATSHENRTATGLIKGKFAYIAPEQAQAHAVDCRADLWSVGVVLWEMLIGRRLFKAENDAATLHATLRADVPRVSLLRPAITPELDRIVLRALQRQPNLRYRQAAEMRQDLQNYLATAKLEVTDAALATFMAEYFTEEIQQQRRLVADLINRDHSRPSEPTRLDGGTQSTQMTGGVALSMEVSRIDTLMLELTHQKRVMRRVAWGMLAAFTAVVVMVIWFVVDHLRQTALAPAQTNVAAAIPAHNSRSIAGAPANAEDATLPPSAPPVVTGGRTPAAAKAELAATAQVTRASIQPKSVYKNHPVAPAAPSNTAKEVPASLPEFGFLTIDSSPWAWVTVKGRSLGQTPVVMAKLPVGTQVLTFRNPDLGLSTSYSVTIEAGKTVVKRIGLE